MAVSFDITFNYQKALLNMAAVANSVDKVKRQTTIRQLSFVRKRAVSSSNLPRRKKPSKPGQSPSNYAQSGAKASLKNIKFDYFMGTDAGIVGPERCNQVNLTEAGRQTVPQLLEFGGVLIVREIAYKKQRTGSEDYWPWRRRDMRRKVKKSEARFRQRKVKIAARPFMSRALQKEIDEGTITSAWANVVGG